MGQRRQGTGNMTEGQQGAHPPGSKDCDTGRREGPGHGQHLV